MTKLDHERWHLRLLDNIRRELKTGPSFSRHEVTLDRFDWFGIEITATQKVADTLNDFRELQLEQQELIANAFESYSDYRKTKFQRAADKYQTPQWDIFVGSAERLLQSIILDLEADRLGFWQWYARFHSCLTKQEKRILNDFGFGLLKTRLPIWLAKDFAASPPSAQHLLRMLN